MALRPGDQIGIGPVQARFAIVEAARSSAPAESSGPDGWLGLERHYGFEYSTGGEDRHAGRIVLHGRRVLSLVGPMPMPVPAGDTGG